MCGKLVDLGIFITYNLIVIVIFITNGLLVRDMFSKPDTEKQLTQILLEIIKIFESLKKILIIDPPLEHGAITYYSSPFGIFFEREYGTIEFLFINVYGFEEYIKGLRDDESKNKFRNSFSKENVDPDKDAKISYRENKLPGLLEEQIIPLKKLVAQYTSLIMQTSKVGDYKEIPEILRHDFFTCNYSKLSAGPLSLVVICNEELIRILNEKHKSILGKINQIKFPVPHSAASNLAGPGQ